jgi:hypothetical protein
MQEPFSSFFVSTKLYLIYLLYTKFNYENLFLVVKVLQGVKTLILTAS